MKRVYALVFATLLAILILAGGCNAAISFWLTYGSTTMITSGSTVSVPANTPITMSAWYRSGSTGAFLVNLMIGYANTTDYANNALPSQTPALSLQGVTYVSGFTGYPPLSGGAFSPTSGSRPYGFFQAGEWASNLATSKQKISDFTLNSALSYGQSVTLTIWGADTSSTYGAANIWTSCLVDTAGNMYRPPSNYYITLTAAPGPPNGVKQVGDGQVSSATGIVTAVYNGFFYIEDSQRISGMRIDGSATVGQLVTASGTMTTTDGERTLSNATVSVTRSTAVPNPMGLTNKALGGSDLGLVDGVDGGFGLNNLGLLVTTTGQIQSVDIVAGSIVLTIDDGSGVGVKVTNISGNWSAGQYVTVTGVAAVWTIDGGRQRMIRSVLTRAV